MQSRTPVLVFGTDLHIDPQLAHYQEGLRVPIFHSSEPAHIVDSSWDYAKYMAFQTVHLFYKLWPSVEKWLSLPVQAAMEAFGRGQRHDSLGNWGRLSAVDPSRGVPRELDDDEVLAFGRARDQEDDPTGEYSLGRFRTNQVISRFVRYQRQHFNVANHIREGAEADTGMVHSSCAALLSKSSPRSLVADITLCSPLATTTLPATSSPLIRLEYVRCILQRIAPYSSLSLR